MTVWNFGFRGYGRRYPEISQGDVEERKEADILKELLLEEGVKESDILIETTSINTSQNFEFSVKLAKEQGHDFMSYLVIQKPYVVLRTIQTLKKVAGDINVQVAAQDTDFDHYIAGDIPLDKILHMLVGETQRIIAYPDIGWTAYIDVPKSVMDAYQDLIARGYTDRMFSDETLYKFKHDPHYIEIKQ